MKRHVIIGNSGAALSALKAIRSVTDEDEIVLISKENGPAYSPVLLTYYLSGNIPFEEIFICDEGFYHQNRVETIWGKKAVRVDSAAKQVFLEDGASVAYDDLLVATGSSPVIPSIKGADLPGLYTMQTRADATQVGEAMRSAAAVAIVGAGLIGMQALEAMLRQGKAATTIEVLPQLLPQILDSEAASILEEDLRQRRVGLRLQETVVEIAPKAGRRVLALASGGEVEVDMVILATGVRPNTDLLEGSGVAISRGVLVDEGSQTSVPAIYAAGDVAEGTDVITGRPQVNATWPNAVEQGRVAGLNMAGENTARLRGLRSNVFTHFGLPFVSLGLTGAEGEGQVELARRWGNTYRKLVFEDEALVGAVLVGEIEEAGLLASLMERRAAYPHLRQELQQDNAFVLHARAFRPLSRA